VKSLAGKVAIVTGAGSGIGQRIAQVLAERGARVVVAASREATAQGTTQLIRDAGGEVASVFGDLADSATPQKIVDAAIAAFGRVDILVNNAAVTDAATLAKDANIADMDGPTWERVLKVNTIAPALLCKAAIPHMIEGGGGSIIMVASGRGVQGDLGLPAYGASKAALINLALNVATQYGKQGIRANSVVVGMVLTAPVIAATGPGMIELFTGHHLTPYVAEPQDIAEPIAFLASDAARFITGATLAVDGGMTSHAAPFADVLKMSAGAGMIRQD
jgi:NAD(P)-dependent dehydrogenase (short-subunit alcohol dehydrogenase family)